MYNACYDVKVYSKDRLTCEIHVRNGAVMFENHSNFPLELPFGVMTSATEDDLEDFYRERCFPEERSNCKDLLRQLGLDYYEPEQICRKTHGLQFDDFLWLQFSDEPQVSWEEIKLRA